MENCTSTKQGGPLVAAVRVCLCLGNLGKLGDRDPYNRIRDRGLERTQEGRSEVTQGL